MRLGRDFNSSFLTVDEWNKVLPAAQVADRTPLVALSFDVRRLRSSGFSIAGHWRSSDRRRTVPAQQTRASAAIETELRAVLTAAGDFDVVRALKLELGGAWMCHCTYLALFIDSSRIRFKRQDPGEISSPSVRFHLRKRPLCSAALLSKDALATRA